MAGQSTEPLFCDRYWRVAKYGIRTMVRYFKDYNEALKYYDARCKEVKGEFNVILTELGKNYIKFIYTNNPSPYGMSEGEKYRDVSNKTNSAGIPVRALKI